jgi:branched-chain amino acid aminotransferase
MLNYDIHEGVSQALAAFRLPDSLGFGLVPAPVMFSALYEDGGWGRGVLLPYGPIDILPGARALHFAEQVFEGMKAYRVGRPTANLFRPDLNCARFARSAGRLSMAAVPDELFITAVQAIASACTSSIPSRSGQSLYIRPFLLGVEPGYAVRNSNRFRFMVIANPSEAYSAGSMAVMIERSDVRAASGGLGTVKAGANYAASLRASTRAIADGYTVVLWLDPSSRRCIEELSGMNLFAVIDGDLHTPLLNDSILAGVTRDSLLTLARSEGLTVTERLMPIDALIGDIRSGRCSEVFACGTAAIVNPISAIGERGGSRYELRVVDNVAKTLRERLLGIQERRIPDPFGWTTDVPAPAL